MGSKDNKKGLTQGKGEEVVRSKHSSSLCPQIHRRPAIGMGKHTWFQSTL